MSATLTEDRLLEETFRPILRRTLAEGFTLRCSHEDLADDAPRPLPLVGIAARRTGENLAITRDAENPASDMELRFECRVDGTLAGSSETLERLAEQVRAAVAGAGVGDFPAWDIVDAVELNGTERGFDGPARTVALTYTLTVLASASV